jgi:hypothetical protein
MPSPTKTVKDDDYIWPDGMYHHVTTFAGFLPADRPQVSITVMMFDTAQGLTGSLAAGPVFSDLAKLSIRELSIAPSNSASSATTTVNAGQPVRSAPATAGSAATEQAILPSGKAAASNQAAASSTKAAAAGASTGASTRSTATSTTIAPSKQARSPSGTG